MQTQYIHRQIKVLSNIGEQTQPAPQPELLDDDLLAQVAGGTQDAAGPNPQW